MQADLVAFNNAKLKEKFDTIDKCGAYWRCVDVLRIASKLYERDLKKLNAYTNDEVVICKKFHIDKVCKFRYFTLQGITRYLSETLELNYYEDLCRYFSVPIVDKDVQRIAKFAIAELYDSKDATRLYDSAALVSWVYNKRRRPSGLKKEESLPVIAAWLIENTRNKKGSYEIERCKTVLRAAGIDSTDADTDADAEVEID
jgi:hypothetical protein